MLKHELKELILNTFNLDQQLRGQKVWSVQAILDFNKAVTKLLIEAVKKFGIPTPETVGQETADKFVVLLSHCTDLKFIAGIIKHPDFVKASFNREDVAIAYDNLLVKSGKKQCYGSVLKFKELKNGTLESFPLPIADRKNVEKRRKEFGVKTTLKQYIENASRVLTKIKR